jgi:hypothetical protein
VKVATPLGDYDYRIERVALRDGGLEVKGRMGEWETTMLVERSDLLEAAKRVVPALVLIGAIAVVTRRRRRVSSN